MVSCQNYGPLSVPQNLRPYILGAPKWTVNLAAYPCIHVCVYLDMLRFVNVQVGAEEAESNEAVGSIRKDVSCSRNPLTCRWGQTFSH